MPSKKELKRKYQAEHIADLQATARASTFSDADVELAIAQHAFIDASSTTGHVDLTKDAIIKSSLPLVPRADKAERDKLQQVVSTAFTLMPRTKDKGKQAPTISRSEKVRLFYRCCRSRNRMRGCSSLKISSPCAASLAGRG